MCTLCRCQMCLHPLPCSRLPSLWFLQGHRVSIRASGLQEPEHSSLSVLPREAQPCLGFAASVVWGASRGKRANPGGPLRDGFTRGLLGHFNFKGVARSQIQCILLMLICLNVLNKMFSNRFVWCRVNTIRRKSYVNKRQACAHRGRNVHLFHRGNMTKLVHFSSGNTVGFGEEGSTCCRAQLTTNWLSG